MRHVRHHRQLGEASAPYSPAPRSLPLSKRVFVYAMLALGFLAAPAGAAVFAFMPKSASAACVAEYTWNGTTTFNISIQQKLYAYQDPTCSGARSVNYAWGASGGIEFDELTWSIWRSWACGSILDNGGTSYGYNVIARYTGPGQHGFLQSWCTPQADQNAHWRDVPYQIDVWHYFNV